MTGCVDVGQLGESPSIAHVSNSEHRPRQFHKFPTKSKCIQSFYYLPDWESEEVLPLLWIKDTNQHESLPLSCHQMKVRRTLHFTEHWNCKPGSNGCYCLSADGQKDIMIVISDTGIYNIASRIANLLYSCSVVNQEEWPWGLPLQLFQWRSEA